MIDCPECDGDDVLVEDFDITGVSDKGELQVKSVSYMCLDCNHVWTR